MNNFRLRELAGTLTEQDRILEELRGRNGVITDQILQAAEAEAYDEGATEGNVTSDRIFAAAKRILSSIELEIEQKLQANIGGN